MPAAPSPTEQLAAMLSANNSAALPPVPDASEGNPLARWFSNGGVAGMLGMTPAYQQIAENQASADAAPDLKSKLAVLLQNPVAGALGVDAGGAMPGLLGNLKDTLIKRGWRLDYTSPDKDGSAASHYLSAPPSAGKADGEQIRISDHDLGSKNGERQGGSWNTKITVDPTLSLDDHLRAIENEEYRSGDGGFSEGYPFDEWKASQ